jgi:hypothetical protein
MSADENTTQEHDEHPARDDEAHHRPAHDAIADAIPEATRTAGGLGLVQEGHPESVRPVAHCTQKSREQGERSQQSGEDGDDGAQGHALEECRRDQEQAA